MERTRIAIIGAGFSGLGMAVRLRQEGITDFVVLERADDIGGTWRDNSYPGCAVDVQSHLYSLSFAPNPDWSAVYAPQGELWAYLRRLVDEHGLRENLRLGHEVLSGDWDDATQRWRLRTSGGDVEAQVLLSGMGPLSNPIPPQIPGLDTFAGTVFHSARWNHDHDLTGRRVAAIGTGSSAAQFVPGIQPHVAHLSLFQRTPGWVIPRMNRPLTRLERALFRRFPALQRLVRRRQFVYRELLGLLLRSPRWSFGVEALAKAHLRRQVKDPVLRDKLTPRFRAGCKRMIVADDYYPAVAQPNVELVTSAVAEVVPEGIRTADGRLHEVDTLILGTGFEILPVADPLRGRDGVTLAELWRERRAAYLGTAVSGFPNYFMLAGPHSATGHTSALLYAEAQMEYALKAIRHLERTGVGSIDVRPEAQQRFVSYVNERLGSTVWIVGGCRSWYLDADGGSSVLWPGTTWEFQRLLSRFDPADYETASSATRREVAAA